MSAQVIEKTVCYIDGFNLYYGLREKGWKKYYWMNLHLLAKNILKPNQQLVCIKYFTARISAGDINTPKHLQSKMEDKRMRQNVYLEALETLADLKIYEGHYLSKIITCKTCGAKWNTHEEKMTDVCIATELIIDSYNNLFDTALIISADSDLVPPINAIRNQFPCKRIVIAFPPCRDSAKLKQVSSAYFPIGESNLRKSMFADEVIKPDSFILKRPVEWAKNVTV